MFKIFFKVADHSPPPPPLSYLLTSKGLVTNYGEGGGYKTGGGGHVKFYPYEKGGQKKF